MTTRARSIAILVQAFGAGIFACMALMYCADGEPIWLCMLAGAATSVVMYGAWDDLRRLRREWLLAALGDRWDDSEIRRRLSRRL